ncbi:MAG: transglycosylase SLT domain-containing protein, partial [Candidatus Binatia bacterium]
MIRDTWLLHYWAHMGGKGKLLLCWLQSLRHRWATLATRLSLSFLFLSLPTHPLDGESGIDQMERAEAQKVHQTFSIYSVLRSHGMEMDEGALWDISEVIVEESKRCSLDPMLVVAMIAVESTFRHDAVSSKGARGLMQIRPFVADALAKEVELEGWEGKKSLDNPIINIKLGVVYLDRLKRKFRDL